MTPESRHPLLAVGLVVSMCAMFAAMDTLVRLVGAASGLLLMLGWRYGTQALLMGLWLARGGRARFASPRPGFQALRGFMLLAMSALTFVALRHMPVAEFTAVVLLGPVFVTVLAAAVLHEPVSPLRWALVGGSLAGALVVIRPGSGLFGWAALLPLTSAVIYAFFQVLTRRLALVEDALTTHFWTGAVAVAALLPLLATGGAPPVLTPPQWAGLVAVGLLGTAGHLLLVLAARLAPASWLMPFTYTQLAFASLFGWLAFDRLPDGWSWVGMALIAACGVVSAWLNLRDAGRAA